MTATTRRARLRARIRVANLILMGALLAYAVAVATSGFLGGLVVTRLGALHSPLLKVLLGLCVWDAGKVLGVALGAVAVARLAQVGARTGGVALTITTYALDLGVALLLGQATGAWTRIEALLGRAAVAILIGWMAVAILRRAGVRKGAPSRSPKPRPKEVGASDPDEPADDAGASDPDERTGNGAVSREAAPDGGTESDR